MGSAQDHRAEQVSVKRSPIPRKTPLVRSPMRRSGRKSKYKRRHRNWDYMAFVRRQPCAARSLDGACDGRVQADHAGRRGMGQKADDRTCIPLCRRHHQCRGDFAGPFKGWNQDQMRQWLERMVIKTSHEFSVQHFGRRA